MHHVFINGPCLKLASAVLYGSSMGQLPAYNFAMSSCSPRQCSLIRFHSSHIMYTSVSHCINYFERYVSDIFWSLYSNPQRHFLFERDFSVPMKIHPEVRYRYSIHFEMNSIVMCNKKSQKPTEIRISKHNEAILSHQNYICRTWIPTYWK